jgi:transcriptional regulator with XRE-family HTH domain
MGVARTVYRKLCEAQDELTQRAFARKLGISVGLVARLTTGPVNMTLSTLAKISRALGVTPSQFLDNADTHHRKGR